MYNLYFRDTRVYYAVIQPNHISCYFLFLFYYILFLLLVFQVEPLLVKLPRTLVIIVIMYPDRGCGTVSVIHDDYEVK